MFQVPNAYLGFVKRPGLPDSGFRASMIPAIDNLTTTPGRAATITVTVLNESDVSWPDHPPNADDFARIRLGNHWLDSAGRMLQQDDGRCDFPDALAPTQKVELHLTVGAPLFPGDYLLELDLVQEGITWFSERGVTAPRLTVHNRLQKVRHGNVSRLVEKVLAIFAHDQHGQAAVIETGDRLERPVIEMPCVAQEEVEAIIRTAGGQVIHTWENNWSGGGYDSIVYVAARGIRPKLV